MYVSQSGGVSGKSPLWNTASMVGSPATLWRHSCKYSQGCGHKFNLYLERLGEPNSRKGVQVQDFSISQATMIQFAENFRFAFPSQTPWSVWYRKWRRRSKSMLWSIFSSPSWGNMLENRSVPNVFFGTLRMMVMITTRIWKVWNFVHLRAA